MYEAHYGFNQIPFSIAPDPAFLYLSAGHREALAHLNYGFSNGGFVLVTGEVGTGKTTLLRNLVSATPDDVDVAFILNPRLTVRELLESICDELGVDYDSQVATTVKQYIDAINRHLLATHHAGRSTVLIIDEAQNLSPAVLEQIRLLTNLETNEKKLLRIILLGQPELAELLARQELRQLAQRITARYHLTKLDSTDTAAYVAHRLARAGASPKIFTRGAISALHRISDGTPRIINVVADRALLGGYVEGRHRITAQIVRRAAQEVLGKRPRRLLWFATGAALLLSAGVAWALLVQPAGYSTARSTTPDRLLPAVPNLPATTATEGHRVSKNPAAVSNTGDTGASPVRADSGQVRGGSASAPQLTLQRPSGISTASTERSAYSEIFRLWKSDLQGWRRSQTPCAFAQTVGFRCLEQRSGWSGVAQLNLPVVLELWDTRGSPYYGALTAVTDDGITLVIDGVTQRTSQSALRDDWYGAFIAIWPIPPAYSGALRAGVAGDSVRWVRDQLNLDSRVNLKTRQPQFFDVDLENAVREFQFRKQLEPDGVVGPLTWIELHHISGAGPDLAGF